VKGATTKVRTWSETSEEYIKNHPEAQSADLGHFEEGSSHLVAILEAILQDDSLMESVTKRADLDKLRADKGNVSTHAPAKGAPNIR